MALCCQDPHPENLRRAGRSEIDLPLNFHPATIRASAVFESVPQEITHDCKFHRWRQRASEG
jgi:hypothetical protein